MVLRRGVRVESYTLRLEWTIDKVVDNSGIFVGFPDGGTDTHSTAISNGYEIQIDQIGRMDGASEHITGAIYDIQGPSVDTRLGVADPTGWNTYEITVDAPLITVTLNGVQVNRFVGADPARDLAEGHLGLQAHGLGDVARFRNVAIRELGDDPLPPPAPVATDVAGLRNATGITHDPRSGADFDGVGSSYSAVALRVAGAAPGATVTAEDVDFTWPDVPSGDPDNIVTTGQQVLAVEAAPGAARLVFLGAADHGPSTAAFQLSYRGTAPDGTPTTTTVDVPVTFGDWTRNGGTAQLPPRNTVALTTPFRMLFNLAPEPTAAHVYAVAVPLDPSLDLESVRLGRAQAGVIHLFDVAVA